MSHPLQPEQLERCWQACWHRARRPVEGVLVTEDEASEIAERALRNAAFDLAGPVAEPDFLARALIEAGEGTRRLVAEKRRLEQDPQVYHDPEDRRYHQNLDLDRLQKRDPERGFSDREWNQLPDLLRPLAFSTLSRKGIRGPDAEEVFNDSLAELVRTRAKDGSAPILDPTVFEELIPLHSRIVGFRAVDHIRRRTTLKNQPNESTSIEALSEAHGHAVQFEDTSADPGRPSFEHIYKECRELLDPVQWELIYTLFVAQSATIQDLIKDEDFCSQNEIRGSASTRRRMINERVENALEKIRESFV